MATKEPALNYQMIIADLMQRAAGPVSVQELAAQMLSLLPSTSGAPQRAMRQHIRQAKGIYLVFLDQNTVLPIRLAFQGARFRIPMEREIFDRGLLPVDDSLLSYLPNYFPQDKIQWFDVSGQPIQAPIQKISQSVQSILGPSQAELSFANLSAWYHAQKMHIKDHLLVTILDWEQGILQLERELFGQRNEALLAERNHLLAEMFFERLEAATREDISVHEVLPLVYGLLPDKGGYPPNHWWDVLEADGRMDSNGRTIFYRDITMFSITWAVSGN